MSDIYKAALMKLMEDKYDLKKFEKIMGGAYGIKYYGEEDMQWKTDVREAVRGGGKGVWGGDDYNNTITINAADPEHGDMYNKYDNDEMGKEFG